MLEEGPDATFERWRDHTAQARLFARPEGSPLLEATIAGAVVQLLERTNPYLAPPGAARLLVNADAASWERSEERSTSLTVPARGALAGVGRVVAREGRTVAIDVGEPVLLTLPPGSEAPEPGTWLRFHADPPLHAFVLPHTTATVVPHQGREVDDAI